MQAIPGDATDTPATDEKGWAKSVSDMKHLYALPRAFG
jgi:hypothetical protein